MAINALDYPSDEAMGIQHSFEDALFRINKSQLNEGALSFYVYLFASVPVNLTKSHYFILRLTLEVKLYSFIPTSPLWDGLQTSGDARRTSRKSMGNLVRIQDGTATVSEMQ